MAEPRWNKPVSDYAVLEVSIGALVAQNSLLKYLRGGLCLTGFLTGLTRRQNGLRRQELAIPVLCFF